MHPEQLLKYQLVADLISSLEAEGYPLGTGKYLQVEELLGRLPDDLPARELGPYLAPVFARTPQQQEQFYDLFRQSLRRIEALNEPDPEPVVEAERSLRRWRWIVILLALALVIPPVYYLIYERTHQQPERIEKAFTLESGEQTIVPLRDTVELKDFGAIDSFELLFSGDALLHQSYALFPEGEFSYQAREDVLGVDSIVYRIRNEKGGKAILSFWPTIVAPDTAIGLEDPPGQEAEKDPIPEPPEEEATSQRPSSATLFSPRPLPHKHDILQLGVQPPPAWKAYIARNFVWLKWLGFFILTLLLLALIYYRLQKRRKLVAEIESSDKPPYHWNVRLPEAGEVTLDAGFGRALRLLRRRTGDESWQLDIPRTIDATIARGGMVDFQFRRRTRPPEYLFLIDRSGFNDHQAGLYNLLCQAFRSGEVFAERFFFSGDLRRCFNENHPRGLRLSELQQRYPASRLVVIGNGYGLLSPATGKLARFAERLKGWKQRLLLSTIPPADWGRRERRLGELFTVLPAGIAALSFWVEELDMEEDARFDLWEMKIGASVLQPVSLQGGLMESLKKNFASERMLQWIAGCAIYPRLHWDLTVYLGGQLSTEQENLLTFSGLQQLLRLPWFRDGRMPDHARSVLLEWLESEHPELSDQLREKVHQVLGDHPPPLDSSAYDDFRLNQALNEWMFSTDRQREKELQQEIANLMDAGVEGDVTVLRELQRKSTPLDFILPKGWKQQFYPEGLPGLGLRSAWRDALLRALPIWLLMLGATLWPWSIELYDCQGEIVEYELQGEPHQLCLGSPADYVLYYEYLFRDAAAAYDGPGLFEVDIKLGELIDRSVKEEPEPILLELDRAYQQYEENITTYLYNQGARYYQKYIRAGEENLNQNTQQTPPSLYDILDPETQAFADSACWYFNNIASFSSLDSLYLDATGWCDALNTEIPVEEGDISVTGRVLDARSGAPIENARVYGGPYSTRTNRNGVFVLEFPQEYQGDPWPVEFGAQGYQSDEQDLLITENKEYTIRLDPQLATYEMTFFTGEVEGAGTSSEVYFRLLGEWGRSERLRLKDYTSPKALYLGARDRAVVRDIPTIGGITGIELSLQDGADPWFLKKVEAQYESEFTDVPIIFECNCWLDKDRSLRTLDVDGPRSSSGDLMLERREQMRPIEQRPPSEGGSELPPPLVQALQEIEENMVYVAGGSFMMGCTEEQEPDCQDNERPAHEINVKGFYLSQFEVTQAQWEAIMGENPSKNKGCSQCPVEQVSWNDIQEFLQKLKDLSDQTYRLPSEAEWEYAARGGNQARPTKYAGSNNLDEVGWFRENSDNITHPVGQKAPNELGLHDMSGNVWEWCQDCWNDSYKGAPSDGSAWLNGDCGRRVLRGGSWPDFAYNCRIAYRFRDFSFNRYSFYGFRLARD